MICSSPIPMTFNGYHQDVSCKQCLPCRINKQKEWTGRILMEMKAHKHASFATLTYNEKNHQTSVTTKAMQQWQKDFRKELSNRYGQLCRFYTVGEYGDKNGRAHYHSIIFGPDPLISEAICQKAWQKGFTSVSPMTPTRAAYCARYTTKKLIRIEPPDGSNPEFAIMSRKPGLGSPYIDKIITTLKHRIKHGNISKTQLVASLHVVRISQKLYPISIKQRKHMLQELGSITTQVAGKKISDHFVIKHQWLSGNYFKHVNSETSGRRAFSKVNNRQDYV